MNSASSMDGNQTFPNSRDGLYLSRRVQERSYDLLQWGGHALLLLSGLHYLELALAVDWLSQPGQLDFARGAIDVVWMPLLGFLLIFYRQEGYVSRWQLRWLGLLSWSALLLASLYAIATILGFSTMDLSHPTELGWFRGLWGVFAFAAIWRMTRWTRSFRG